MKWRQKLAAPPNALEGGGGGGGNKRRVEREIEAEAAHPWTGRWRVRGVTVCMCGGGGGMRRGKREEEAESGPATPMDWKVGGDAGVTGGWGGERRGKSCPYHTHGLEGGFAPCQVKAALPELQLTEVVVDLSYQHPMSETESILVPTSHV